MVAAQPPQVAATPLGSYPAALSIRKGLTNTVFVDWTAPTNYESAIESKPIVSSGGVVWSPISAWFAPTSGTNVLQLPRTNSQMFYRVVSRPTNAPAPCSLVWRSTGTADSATQARSTGVAVDHAGNTIAVGRYTHTLDFGGGVLTNASEIGFDAFIVKYSPSGALLWQKRLGSVGDDGIRAVAVDSQNNILVTGNFVKTVDFGGVILTSFTNANLTPDAFIAKYSPAGGLLWVKQFGGISSEIGAGVGVDASDNVFFTSTLESANVPWGGANYSSAGSYDIFVAKVSSAGNALWAKRVGLNDSDNPFGLAVDRNGDVFVCGTCFGNSDLGGGTIGAGLYLVKYSGTNGNFLWQQTVNQGSALSVATDPNNGNVVVTGQLSSPANFGGGVTASGGIFLAGYSTAGVNLFGKTFNNATFPPRPDDSGNGVAVDASGIISLTGSCGLINFSGTSWQGRSVQHFFTSSFTSAGVYRCVFHAGGTGTSAGFGTAFDTSGHVATTGWFNGTIDFGGGQTATTPAVNGAPFVAEYTE